MRKICGIWDSKEEMEESFNNNDEKVTRLLEDFKRELAEKLRPNYRDLLDNLEAADRGLDGFRADQIRNAATRVTNVLDAMKPLLPEEQHSPWLTMLSQIKDALDILIETPIREELLALRNLIQLNMNRSIPQRSLN